MVKFLPNNDWFDEGAIYARIDPVRFAESGYQRRQQLKRSLVATVDRNQSRSALEKALQAIRISVPNLKGSPYLVSESYLTHIYAKTEKNGPVRLGELIDLF
jgi:hypothetical protein